MNWFKFIGSVVIDEIRLKSKYQGLGNDTLMRCLLSIILSVGFYFFIYNFDANATKFDHWLKDVFGWELSTPPSERKVQWHRLVAGIMSGVGIFSAVGEYSICLYRRIKARLHQHSLALRGLPNQH